MRSPRAARSRPGKGGRGVWSGQEVRSRGPLPACKAATKRERGGREGRGRLRRFCWARLKPCRSAAGPVLPVAANYGAGFF
jgi:hypothetical protein